MNPLVEVLRRYSNRPDLLGPLLEVLRRIEAGDRADEPGGVASREGGSLRPSDRLSEADVHEIVERFRAGAPKHKLAAEYGMSLSTMKRLLRRAKREEPPARGRGLFSLGAIRDIALGLVVVREASRAGRSRGADRRADSAALARCSQSCSPSK
jgi:hypothetical protein